MTRNLLRYLFFSSLVLASSVAAAITCTAPQVATTICTTTFAACVPGTAPDPNQPPTQHTLPYTYIKVDPAGTTTCTGDNGPVSCPALTTTSTYNVLPFGPGFCSWNPNNQLPSTPTCNYQTNPCVVTCTATTDICV